MIWIKGVLPADHYASFVERDRKPGKATDEHGHETAPGEAMLTATYSFSVITAEQRQVRSRIDLLQQALLAKPARMAPDSCDQARNAMAQLLRLHADFQLRKIQTHVVPALSCNGADAASLLGEIAALADEAGRLLDALTARLSAARDAASCEALKASCERYLACLRERLRKEDQQLIPLAWRLLSSRQWFAIATACLAEMQAFGKKPPGRVEPASSGARIAARPGRMRRGLPAPNP